MNTLLQKDTQADFDYLFKKLGQIPPDSFRFTSPDPETNRFSARAFDKLKLAYKSYKTEKKQIGTVKAEFYYATQQIIFEEIDQSVKLRKKAI